MNENKKSRFLPYSLGVLQAFIGVTAVMGGFGLVLDPTGTKSNVSLEWLSNSPFPDYFVPGLVLLTVIGGGNVLASIVTFLQSRYAGSLAIGLGSLLILYMITEVGFVGLRNLLQPLYFVLGVIAVILGMKLSKSIRTARQIWLESTMDKLPT